MINNILHITFRSLWDYNLLTRRKKNVKSPFLNDFGGGMKIFKWAEKQPTTYRKSIYIRTAYSNSTLMDSTQGTTSRNFLCCIM